MTNFKIIPLTIFFTLCVLTLYAQQESDKKEKDREIELEEVVISGHDGSRRISQVEMGIEKLKIQEIKKMPALMGEVDILKAIQLLPGVQATSEGGSGFSVRGGAPDQNLILIDNTTVYNASHLMGFFSIFNNDVVSGLELYKGDLPLKHGGRLSSLLDVRTWENIPDHIEGSGGLGLISSRLMMRGPVGENTSWLVGGRRSYADLFFVFSNDESIRNTIFYFYDMNVKMTHRFSGRDNVSFSGYVGKDVFGAKEMGRFSYGNTAGSLTWNHTFSENLYSKFSINVSNYKYGIGSEIDGQEVDLTSRIFDVMTRAEFNQPINNTFNLNYGLAATLHQFHPGLITQPGYPDFQIPKNQAVESGIYLSNEQKVSDKLSLKYGLRWSVFQNIGATTLFKYDENYEVTDSIEYGAGKIYNAYHAFEPRLGFMYKVGKEASVKANYAHNTQFIQLANNSASGSPLNVWFAAGPNVKPQQVDLFSVGYFQNFQKNKYEASIELYYKTMNHVIDFKDHPNLLLNPRLDGEVRPGTGKAYGAELMIRKNSGYLTGFLNYTLSRSYRTIPEINNGKPYLSPYDKTHYFNAVLNYEFSKKLNVSATWVFATGNPTTYPTGRFAIGNEYFPIYSDRNEYRMPNYDRLDLSLTYIPKPNKKWQGEWNFSLYNAYGKKNAWLITFDQDNFGGIPYAEMFYLFSVVPSITYNFKF